MPELYLFRTEIDEWRYNDGKANVSALGQTWTPQPITRTDWKKSVKDQEIKITLPTNVDPADQFILTNPATVLWVDIYSDAGALRFTGKVRSAQYNTKRHTVELRTTALSSIMSGDVPQRKYSPNCPYNLGDSDCGINLDDFKVVVPVADATISGNTLTHADIGTEADGYWTGGFVANGPEKAYIVGHTGTTLYLLNPFVRTPNDEFDVFAGCDKARATCVSKFDNVENFGGYANVPSKNPVVDGV